MKVELNLTRGQVNLIQDALQGYLTIASDFLSYDELNDLNIMVSNFLVQIPDELYEE